MDFGSQAGNADAAFSNISATPEACEQRQVLFLRFLNEFQTTVEYEGSDRISSQASQASQGMWLLWDDSCDVVYILEGGCVTEEGGGGV